MAQILFCILFFFILHIPWRAQPRHGIGA